MTEQEKQALLWDEGDWLEVVSGTITFTSKRVYKGLDMSHPTEKNRDITIQSFFFEADSASWKGSREWTMHMMDPVPNGPALLIIYRRGEYGWAYGAVSLLSKGWVQVAPMNTCGAFTETPDGRFATRFGLGDIPRQTMTLFALGAFLCLMIVGIVVVLYAVVKMQIDVKRFLRLCGRQINAEPVARAMMFRIAKNCGQYVSARSQRKVVQL